MSAGRISGRHDLQVFVSQNGRALQSVTLAFTLGIATLPVAGRAQGTVVRVAYTAEGWSNSGGLHDGSKFLQKLDAVLDWRASDDIRLYLHIHATGDGGLSEELVGDLQGASNIDAPQDLRLFEAWYEKSVGARHSLRAGIYDLNSEFDTGDAAQLFVNSSHGIGPELGLTGENGPSIYPVTGLALRWAAQIADNLESRFAILDAVPGNTMDSLGDTLRMGAGEGALLIGELEVRTAAGSEARFGAWGYTESTPVQRSAPELPQFPPASGAYAAVEVPITATFTGFLRFGSAAEAGQAVSAYAGVGVVWQPDWRGHRPAFGIAIAHARASRAHRRLVVADGGIADAAETAVELTARIALPHGFALHPNVQRIFNPGALAMHEDSWLLGVRLEWQLERSGPM